MARLIALAPTMAEAEAIARRGAQWLVDAYAGPQHAHRKKMPPRTYDGKEPAQHYVDSVILHGTPEALIDQIAELKETIGLNYLMCAPLSRDSFRLLADKVVPRLPVSLTSSYSLRTCAGRCAVVAKGSDWPNRWCGP